MGAMAGKQHHHFHATLPLRRCLRSAPITPTASNSDSAFSSLSIDVPRLQTLVLDLEDIQLVHLLPALRHEVTGRLHAARPTRQIINCFAGDRHGIDR